MAEETGVRVGCHTKHHLSTLTNTRYQVSIYPPKDAQKHENASRPTFDENRSGVTPFSETFSETFAL